MPKSHVRKDKKKTSSKAHKENLRRASANRLEQRFNDVVAAIEELKAKQKAEDE